MQVFGNKLSAQAVRRAKRSAARLARKYGYSSDQRVNIVVGQPKAQPPLLGIHPLISSQNDQPPLDLSNGIVLGTIRMGFGHYRMALALASAAQARGLTPYWLDFLGFPETPVSKIIHYLDGLYRFGSRLSQRWPLFNNLVWERLTSEFGRPVSGTARYLALAKILAQVPKGLAPDTPYIATHPWTAQAAVAAGLTNVVNIIPDNMPLAFHLAEGAVHTVQTASAYLGYRTLREMGKLKSDILSPMNEGAIVYSGHYVDHELVANLEGDCARRLDRMAAGAPRRILMTIGGAGAQLSKFIAIIRHMKQRIHDRKVTVLVNLGDHYSRWAELKQNLSRMRLPYQLWDDDWKGFQEFTDRLHHEAVGGIFIFLHRDTFPAVYSTNLLMRESDVLITKPSELSFYPVPKLFIQRVGKHETMGAIHSSEIGDGSLETTRMPQVLQILDVLLNQRDLLSLYIERLIANKRAGVYDGAYRAVDLVLSNRKIG
jgi:hypothetical protein